MAVLAVSFFMRAHLNAQADYMSVAIAMFVLGAGVPACLVTLTSLAVSDLPPEKVANGSGLQNFIRIMAMAVGASLTSTYWENATKASRANLVVDHRSDDDADATIGASGRLRPGGVLEDGRCAGGDACDQ